MDYELAKELKDAGFPQEGHFYYSLHTDPPTRWDINVLEYKGLDAKDIVLCPTLEELIEACGDGFFSLERHLWPPAKKTKPSNFMWHAISGKKGRIPESYFEVGATPAEAVARLWLSLNNK